MSAEAVKEVFRQEDSTGSGLMDRDSLLKIMGLLLTPDTAAAMEGLFGQVFEPNEEQVSYEKLIDFVWGIESDFPGLPGVDLSDLSAAFQLIDRNSDNLLSKDEVLRAVKNADASFQAFCQQIPSLHPLLSTESWEAAFMQMDTNKNGMISWFEFVSFFQVPEEKKAKVDHAIVPQQGDLSVIFASIDVNLNGFLEKDELLKAVKSTDSALYAFCMQMPALQELLKPETWEDQFQSMDTNQDGRISWKEFWNFFGKS